MLASSILSIPLGLELMESSMWWSMTWGEGKVSINRNKNLPVSSLLPVFCQDKNATAELFFYLRLALNSSGTCWLKARRLGFVFSKAKGTLLALAQVWKKKGKGKGGVMSPLSSSLTYASGYSLLSWKSVAWKGPLQAPPAVSCLGRANVKLWWGCTAAEVQRCLPSPAARVGEEQKNGLCQQWRWWPRRLQVFWVSCCEAIPTGQCSGCSSALGISQKTAVALWHHPSMGIIFSKQLVFLICSPLHFLLLFRTRHLAFLGKCQTFR